MSFYTYGGPNYDASRAEIDFVNTAQELGYRISPFSRWPRQFLDRNILASRMSDDSEHRTVIFPKMRVDKREVYPGTTVIHVPPEVSLDGVTRDGDWYVANVLDEYFRPRDRFDQVIFGMFTGMAMGVPQTPGAMILGAVGGGLRGYLTSKALVAHDRELHAAMLGALWDEQFVSGREWDLDSLMQQHQRHSLELLP